MGQRVLTVGTLATAQLPGDDPTEINPAIYRLVRLRTTKPLGGGSVVHAALLRQLSWLSENHVVEGGMIPFCVPELSIEGPACVLAIEPCPEIEPGRGRVITGTFRTTNCRVLQVRLPGEDRPLEPTPPHRFKSLDRNDWIPAEELRIGENLQTKAGQVVTVESIGPKPGLHRVHNFEVEGEHHFFVGKTGVLVHNSYSTAGTATVRLESIEGQRVPHYTVETDFQGVQLHTEQLVDKGAGTTTITEALRYQVITQEGQVDLPDAEAAQVYQESVLRTDTGPYDYYRNSCVTHVVNVLNAGGLDLPTSTGLARAALQRLLGG